MASYTNDSYRLQKMLRQQEPPPESRRTKIKRESPLFRLQRIEYTPRSTIKVMRVCNDIVVLAIEGGILVRLDLQNASNLQEIDLVLQRKKGEKGEVSGLFLSPDGNHVIASMENGENLYVHKSSTDPKVLSKLRGVKITSVGWNPTANGEKATCTGDILLGTAGGLIMECNIDQKEKYANVVFNIQERKGIQGLHLVYFPGSSTKMFVFACSTTRLYEFVGGPTFTQLFASYEEKPNFIELSGNLDHSELCIWGAPGQAPSTFSWLTQHGVYHGKLSYNNHSSGDSVVDESTLLSYIPFAGEKSNPAISIGLTQFHHLLLSSDGFQAVSNLDDSVAFQESTGSGGPQLQGLCRDVIKGTIWIYAKDSIFRVTVTREDRNVWRQYLEKEKFDEALVFTHDDPRLKDIVWTAQAEHFLNKKLCDLAAKFYARTSKSFEEITLKFITMGERDALKTYLENKLSNLRGASKVDHPSTQKTLLATWLTEIYLNKLNELRSGRLTERHLAVAEEFRNFLEGTLTHFVRPTMFQLLGTHGRIEEMLFYASLINDFEKVIEHHIGNRDYARAVDIMSRQTNADNFYHYSPILIRYVPSETVKSWIQARVELDPRKLIPSLLKYDRLSHERDLPNQAIRFLVHCVTKLQNTDEAIHNYLLSLFVQESEEDLIRFINREPRKVDLKYALRLCTKEKKDKACVYIYSAMGLYEEAVEKALGVDIELAKFNANMPEDNDEMRKKLWLKIARHVVEEELDIKRAMEFLKQCDLLKIEDILPFFPDFVIIDDFKEEICNSLTHYNDHIHELKDEMAYATESAKMLREDIQDLRNRYGVVQVKGKCDLCKIPIVYKDFYMFPCQHVFHADCLTQEVLKHAGPGMRERVLSLQQRLEREPKQHPSKGKNKMALTNVQKMTKELNDLVAAECLFCGKRMIDEIDRPFVNPSLSEDADWKL